MFVIFNKLLIYKDFGVSSHFINFIKKIIIFNKLLICKS